jgi:acetyl-CoA decarbonylase/synthase complex subunit delta
MAELFYQKWSGKINEVLIGQEPKVLRVGGEEGLPFLFKEGKIPHQPKIAFEVWDIPPVDWPQELAGAYKGALENSLEWAKMCVEQYKAELIFLRLQGAHPDYGNKSKEAERKLIAQIIKNINVPLVIIGCADDAKDNEIMPSCCEEARGRNCLVGEATQDNYRTLTVAALADEHSIIAQSPIDININPTIGALGYGLEYAYSIMERARLAALSGDKMLAMPFICCVGQEAWRAKEAKATQEEFPQWGSEKQRGIIWEATTAVALLQAGADILVMRHPKAVDYMREYIKRSHDLANNSEAKSSG